MSGGGIDHQESTASTLEMLPLLNKLHITLPGVVLGSGGWKRGSLAGEQGDGERKVGDGDVGKEREEARKVK